MGFDRTAATLSGSLRRTAIAALVLFALNGCVRKPDVRLEDACQFHPCTCADESAAFWQLAATKPIQWRANGEASCPPGYTLKMTGKD